MDQVGIWANEEPEEANYQKQDPEYERTNELNDQNRNLRLLIPIYRIEQNKSKVGGQAEADGSSFMDSIDTVYLSILVLEYYAAYALSRESVPAKEVIAYLGSKVLKMSTHFHPAESTRIAAWIHDSLCNQAENYKSFDFSYFNPSQQAMQRIDFWLIKIEKVGDGNECKITEEGVSALLTYINANPKLNDEVTALLTQRLIKMGRYDDALQMAERSKKEVIQYQERISSAAEKVRRENKAGKLSHEVLPLIQQSSEHVKDRIAEEDTTLRSLDDIEYKKLSSDTLILVKKLKSTITDNLGAYQKLYDYIDATYSGFEATFRSFLRPSSKTIPNMVNDLLKPLCKWHVQDLSEQGDPILNRIMPAKPPAIFDVITLLDALDIAGEQEHTEPSQTQDADMQEITRINPLFPEEMIADCRRYYQDQLGHKQQTSLLELLQEAKRASFSEEFQRCLSYVVVLSYADNESIQSKAMGLHIQKNDRFHHDFVVGDNLSISLKDTASGTH